MDNQPMLEALLPYFHVHEIIGALLKSYPADKIASLLSDSDELMQALITYRSDLE